MPALWEFGLRVQRPQLVTGRDLHWLCSTWLDLPADSASGAIRSGAAVEHKTGLKPWSIRGLRRAPDGILVQVGTLDEISGAAGYRGLSDDLLLGVRACLGPPPPGERRTLGEGGEFSTRAFADAGHETLMRRVASDDWESLRRETVDRRWHLTFETTTSFKSGQFPVPFPLPNLVIKSLQTKWTRFGPPLGTDPLRTDRSLELVTLDVNIRRSVESGILGFVGWADHAAVPRRGRAGMDELDLRALGSLLALIPYTGVGISTAMGLGVTRRSGARSGGVERNREAPR